MDFIMERCPGVISIHDDIVVYGVSEEDHDANLVNLLNVAQIEDLVLNSKKLELKCPRVSFFGAEYSADGMHPCPRKIQGITEMTPPTDKQQLGSFIGMVTYMGNFVPHLSHHTEPLHSMLKQEAVFAWDEMANASFQKIKDLIARSATKPLRYYDRRKPVTVQADASQRGLGACLLQDGQPIAYTSKSLTDTETRYANIERELLAIVFACQQFNTYVLGRPFTVESDHKPLEMIHQKSLASAPPRLQRMLLQLQRYDVTIRYRPGKEMLPADALSRCPSRASGEIKPAIATAYKQLPAHSAGVATSKEAYSQNCQGILGLQRPALYRRGTAPDGPQNCHSILPSGGVSSKTPPGPSLSHQGTAECSSTPILARAGCGYSRLHKEMPGMHTPISASQRATASSRGATRALGENCDGLLLHEWQVVYFDLWLLQ